MTATRKVIRLAQKTLVVSLPAAWCKANKIGKGDELFCEERAARLVVSPKSVQQKSVVELDGDATGVLLKRVLNELYHAGVDRVEVRAKQNETRARLNNALNQLIGYHVIEQRGTTVVIEDLARDDQNLDVILRRFLLLIKTMFEDGLGAAERRDVSALAAIAGRDTDVNKFAHLCIRCLHKRHQLESHHAARLHTMIYLAEQLGDDVMDIIVELKNNSACSMAVLPALREAAKLYEQAYHFVFQRTLQNALAVAYANERARESMLAIPIRKGNSTVLAKLGTLLKKAVSIQELFLHDVQGVRHEAN